MQLNINDNNLEYPAIFKNITLLSPGVWNDLLYSTDEIRKAYSNTDWNDNNVISLFLDHPENAKNAAGQWAGWVKNLSYDGKDLKGDLEVWHAPTIINLKLAKAKFGVSPRLVSNQPKEIIEMTKQFCDFTFDNFSIVSKPAQSTSYINLSEQNKENQNVQIIVTNEISAAELSESQTLKQEAIATSPAVTTTQVTQIPAELNSTPTMEEHNVQEMKGGFDKDSIMTGENSVKTSVVAELSDSDVLSIITQNLSAFNAFKESMKDSNMSIKELAGAYKKKMDEGKMYECMSESELHNSLSAILGAMKSKGLVPQTELAEKVDEKPAVELAAKEENKVIAELSAKIASLEKTLNTPVASTMNGAIAELSAIDAKYVGKHHSDAVANFAEYLKGL